MNLASDVYGLCSLAGSFVNFLKKGITISAKNIVGKGIRGTAGRFRRFSEASSELIMKTVEQQQSELLSNMLDIDVGSIVTRIAERAISGDQHIPYGAQSEFFDSERYEIVERELKPHPSRYYITEFAPN